MVLLFGSNFDSTRLVSRVLQSFYGIGAKTCEGLMARKYMYKRMRMGELVDKQIKSLEAELSSMTIENALRRQLRENIARLRDMGTYRGRRHAMGLPVRGQRTRTQIQSARRLNKVDRKG